MPIVRKRKSQYSKYKQFRISSPLLTRIVLGILMLLLIGIFVKIKLVVFLIVITAFNSWLAGFQLKRGFPTDLELSTFATVQVTMAFDIKWGIFTAVFTKLIASLWTGNLIADHFFMILTYLFAALVTWIVGGNILILGIAIVILNAIIMYFISKNILGIDVTANLSYTGTNLIFNLLVFSIFSLPIFNILN